MTDWYTETAKDADPAPQSGRDWYGDIVSSEATADKIIDESEQALQGIQRQEPQGVQGQRRPMSDIVSEKMPQGFSFGEMLGNIPSSAGQLAKDIVTPVISPIETAKAVGKTASGFIDKGAEALASSLPDGAVSVINKFNNALVDIGLPLERLPENAEEMNFKNTKYANSVIGFFEDRYGSTDNFLQTLESDPVGVVSDITGVMMGGGTLVPKVGGKISSLGTAIDPVNLAIRGGSKAVANIPGVKKLPGKLYQSAAKFGTTIEPKKRTAMTQTALDEKIMPRTAGVDKARNLINGLNEQIDDLIKNTTDTGQTVSRDELYKYIKDIRLEYGQMNLDATKDLKKIDNIIDGFESHLDSIGKTDLTPIELQNLKKNIYRRINYDKKKMKGSQVADDTKKAVARAAKEQLEELIPEVKQLNQKEGSILELVDSIERSASRIENRDLIGIGIPIKGAMGGIVAGPEGALSAITLGLLDTPTIKAKLAIVLNDVQKLDLSEARKKIIAAQVSKLMGRTEQSLGEPVIDEEQSEIQDGSE